MHGLLRRDAQLVEQHGPQPGAFGAVVVNVGVNVAVGKAVATAIDDKAAFVRLSLAVICRSIVFVGLSTLHAEGGEAHGDAQRVWPGQRPGAPHTGNQRARSDSIRRSSPMIALTCSSRGLSRFSAAPGSGAKG